MEMKMRTSKTRKTSMAGLHERSNEGLHLTSPGEAKDDTIQPLWWSHLQRRCLKL
ncbi:unnamed protein product, partial [Ilex paraguariensis]